MQDRQDRRVLRSRAALMAAAVRLVSERGTTALPITDLADAADVSRQLVYLQFGDRDALLVAAAADLVERELMPEVGDNGAPRRARMLAMARHFARHRSFYRAMLTGSCAFLMTRALNRLFGSLITMAGVRELLGDLDDATVGDFATLITGGTGAIVNDWLIDADDPLDPEELADRLLRLSTVFVRSRPAPGGRPR
ncbi:TetR/AcrR family transcriptional regulator [Nonomuraea sp. NEAU-A123]|uniref:TetR/AcrR family transcriptional regulator n=1 Tax=Nonomuraea sp. NEAU-A123 TaxID=2839649 RepID=UPI001BE44776|nr:TetR-like C-terminal domain-containing protein [Nonomuraea sp. NEAU-A123]MBT2233512.1 TetR family transcriptional regulator [Nonomuraea sp. NEAU-A123]